MRLRNATRRRQSPSTSTSSSSTLCCCRSETLVSGASFVAGALTFVALSNMIKFHSLIIVGSAAMHATDSKVPSIQVWLSGYNNHDSTRTRSEYDEDHHPDVPVALPDTNAVAKRSQGKEGDQIIHEGAPAIRNDRLALVQNFVKMTNENNPNIDKNFHWSLTNPQDIRLLFVHVGKAGGMSLNSQLKVLDQTRKFLGCRIKYTTDQDFRRDACRQVPGAGKVAKLTLHIYGHLHRNFPTIPATEAWLVNHANVLLFTVRDPIDRITSAFNYARYMIFEFTGAAKGKKYAPAALAFYNVCFRDMTECATALDPRNITTSTQQQQQHPCREMALPILQGQTQVPDLDHFYYNYAHYVNRVFPASAGKSLLTTAFAGGTNPQQPPKPTSDAPAVVVIRTEQMWEDTARLETWAGGRARRFLNQRTKGLRVSHGSESFAVTTGIRGPLAVGMCCVLADDIQVYQDLIVVALNLKRAEKVESLQSVRRRCGVALTKAVADNGKDQASLWMELASFSWTAWARETCHV